MRDIGEFYSHLPFFRFMRNTTILIKKESIQRGDTSSSINTQEGTLSLMFLH